MKCTVHRAGELELTCEAWDWPFARERRAEIEAHFAAQQAARPHLWNGRVLLGRQPRFSSGAFSGRFFETDFASFVAWRDWGFPDTSVFNGFGMGVLRSRDGAFVLGEMGPHTVSAGQIYFPGGTPDPDDVVDKRLDIVNSLVRELIEETGIAPSDYSRRPEWICVDCGVMIAMLSICDVDLDGDSLKDRIEANLAAQETPELARIHLVRGPGDLTPAMPAFVAGFVEHCAAHPE